MGVTAERKMTKQDGLFFTAFCINQDYVIFMDFAIFPKCPKTGNFVYSLVQNLKELC